MNNIKNQALLKRGGYSAIITAIVLAGLIAINWLMGMLTEKYNLTIDMTENQENSISESNIEYLKTLDTDVTITVFCSKDDFAYYMAQYAYYYYGVEVTSEEDPQFKYFEQTITLLEKYDNYNDHITIKYIDPESTAFNAITSKYSSEEYSYSYGTIMVTGEKDGIERVKFLNFEDIYVLENYYYYYYSITGNALESSLTSAIDYVAGADVKNVAIISGHSSNNYTDAYIELLTINNYKITEIDDQIIGEISSDYDMIVISAPTRDFAKSEIDAISDFLENDGHLGKGLVYFADAYCPYLPNLSSFLEQWGIKLEEGIVFQTDGYYCLPNDPTTMPLYTTDADDDILDDFSAQIPAIAGSNVPMTECTPASSEITTTTLMAPPSATTVVAPIGSSETWADYTKDDMRQLSSVIQSKRLRYDNDIEDINDREITSYVMAFSSVEFVQSEYATSSTYKDYYNQEITLACTSRAADKRNGYTFESKVIAGESFSDEVRANDVKNIGIIYVWVIPLSVLAAGVVIFIIRRKAV